MTVQLFINIGYNLSNPILQIMPGLEYCSNHSTMKAITAEVESHPSVFNALQGRMMMILSTASLPFATHLEPATDFSVLFVLQKAKLSAEEIAHLFQSYPVVQCCAKCLSRDKHLLQCIGCGVNSYCSQSCQGEHRTEHGKYCAMLKALVQSGHRPNFYIP